MFKWHGRARHLKCGSAWQQRRQELHAKFTESIKDVQEKMDLQDKERIKQAEENDKLREQLQSFLDQYEVNRSAHHVHISNVHPTWPLLLLTEENHAGSGEALRTSVEAERFGVPGLSAQSAVVCVRTEKLIAIGVSDNVLPAVY